MFNKVQVQIKIKHNGLVSGERFTEIAYNENRLGCSKNQSMDMHYSLINIYIND